MNIKSREIKRAVRDFENIAIDLSNARWEDYISLVKRLMNFINQNKIITKIIEPLNELSIDEEKYCKKRDKRHVYVSEPNTILRFPIHPKTILRHISASMKAIYCGMS